MENTKEKNLICFLGTKRSGKDYQSQKFIDLGYKKVALADSLRNMLWDILGWTPTNSQYEKCKATYMYLPEGIINFIKTTTIRKMLQNLGSYMRNNFGENYWVNRWCEEVLKYGDNVVCTDVRYPNEIKKALSLSKKGYNVEFVWCAYECANYTEILKDTHESEALAQFLYLNKDKYKLYDGCKINTTVLKKILKDYNK